MTEDDDYDNKFVKMHDLVREMALWLACDIEKQEERFVVQASLGLHEVPRVKDWSIVRKMSLMNNEIQEISSRHECPHLTTLILIIRSSDIWEMEIGRTSWDIILTRKD